MLYFARWKIILIIVICLGGVLFASPNVLPRFVLGEFPDWIPHQQVNLGLDLRGGSHLLLEVDMGAVSKERLEVLRDDVRVALRQNSVRYRGLASTADAVVVTIIEPDRVSAAREALETLISPLPVSLLNPVSTPDIEIVEEGQSFTVRPSTQATLQRNQSTLAQSIEIVRRRVDELGTTEPTIQRQGAQRILVQVPGLDDPERLKDLLGQTAKMTFHLVNTQAAPDAIRTGRAPAGYEILYTEEEEGVPSTPLVVQRRVMVSGENLVDAQPSFDEYNMPVVTFRFDTAGGRRFGEITQQNVGNPFAIVLDGKVISAPVIREAILGGSGQISGNFTVQSANDLAILLRAGALPAPLHILEERTVGPGLGADSVRAGSIASLFGLVGVIVFMFLSYGRFGFYADVSLLVNLTLILGVLSLLQATLTLPGIAGIVLTIGMAVDANVLIFERIREEIRSGKPPLRAVDAGYSRALGTILDANITTLIAALVLFQIGSGPVRGFAVTLAIGIVTSVFTAFTLTRLMITWWLRRRKPQALAI
ncbi:MAG: protein translocase subunit SecD [Parvularculales bacterium]